MIARFLRSSYRIPGFLLLSLVYTFKLGVVRIIHGADRHRIHRILIEFIHRVYAIMGIRVFVEGELPEKPSILMGNHRSYVCLLYTSPSPRDRTRSRMPSSA